LAELSQKEIIGFLMGKPRIHRSGIVRMTLKKRWHLYFWELLATLVAYWHLADIPIVLLNVRFWVSGPLICHSEILL
jgi:hypothetical protein